MSLKLKIMNASKVLVLLIQNINGFHIENEFLLVVSAYLLVVGACLLVEKVGVLLKSNFFIKKTIFY